MTFVCVVICLIIWGICGCIVYFVFDAFFGENKIIDVGMGILTYSVMTLLLAMIFKKVPFISNAMLVEVWVRGAHISGFDFMIFGPAAYALFKFDDWSLSTKECIVYICFTMVFNFILLYFV